VAVVKRLRQHQIILRGERVLLRPLTEGDWPAILKWNNDPQVLHFVEGDEVSGYSLEEVQQIYRSVCQNAFCFIIELEGQPIGECWLQPMNLERVLDRYPGRDCRRIELVIGERTFWGQGLGTEVIRLLVALGFKQERADLIFGCDVAEDNRASLRAFQKAGFQVPASLPQAPGSKVRHRYDLVLTKEHYFSGTLGSGEKSDFCLCRKVQDGQ
jgi:RimJ/RimL family protein N-acetyltransferase